MTEKINLNRLVNSFLNASFGKKVVAGIFIISVILSLGWAAQQGVAVSLTLELKSQLDYLEVQQQILNDTINIPVNSTISAMVKTASYIISQHNVLGTMYFCLINGSDDRAGRLEYYGTNARLTSNYALGNGTGIVHWRVGFYPVDAAVTPGSNDIMEGEGETTIIKATGSGYSAIEVVGSGLSWYAATHLANVTIRNLHVIGNGTGTGDRCIKINYCDDSLVENVHLEYAGASGIVIDNWCTNVRMINSLSENNGIAGGANRNGVGTGYTMHVQIMGNTMKNNPNNGIELDKTWADVVENNIVFGNNGAGIYLINASDTIVSGNMIYDSTGTDSYDAGIRATSLWNENNTVTNNVVRTSGGYGIYVTNGKSFTITGNSLIGNNKTGIRLETCNGMSVSSNQILGNTGSTTKGIYLYKTSNCTITANTIADNGDEGITIAGSGVNASYNIVMGNTILRNGDDGVRMGNLADHCAVEGNIILNNVGYGIDATQDWYCLYLGNIMNGNTSGNDVQGESATSIVEHNIIV